MKGEVPEDYYTIPLGKADIKREGNDVTLFAVGKQVNTALEAVARLSEKGIDAEVLDPRSLSPLDEEAIFTSLEKTNRLIIIDEANPRCKASPRILSRLSPIRALICLMRRLNGLQRRIHQCRFHRCLKINICRHQTKLSASRLNCLASRQ